MPEILQVANGRGTHCQRGGDSEGIGDVETDCEIDCLLVEVVFEGDETRGQLGNGLVYIAESCNSVVGLDLPSWDTPVLIGNRMSVKATGQDGIKMGYH